LNEKILVVDDEKSIVDILKYNLQKEGYQVFTGMDGGEALQAFERCNPDLVLLDVMMPVVSGYDVCRKIREKSTVPIIMLTARTEEVDKVLGLELGADDYVTKPFSVRELMARVRANLRRSTVQAEAEAGKLEILRSGDIEVDVSKYAAAKKGKPLQLTVREMELLKFFMYQRGQIFTREYLLSKVWGYEYFGDARTVDVTVRRLREKIEDNPSSPVYILTKRGVGYYFTDK
jgi:two-component system response regulator VicR